ncbi:MAG TPA: hypothetical protein VLV88_01890 [Terriglobales bacterium]|nr:hypothetical protein [Terriglobales bacterium]
MASWTHLNRSELEWRLLRLFVAHAAALHSRTSKPELLRAEDFADPVHRALFEEILHGTQRTISAEELRRWLPAAMTRRGWPDLDFEDLFRADNLESPRDDFAELLKILRAYENRRGEAP